MPKYCLKLLYLEASQWFKNGDHPNDFDKEKVGYENGELRTWTGAEVKSLGWEGQVVRYFRHPDIDGKSICTQCGKTWHEHGWIDNHEGGHNVCPGDYIITADGGGYYPLKSDVFESTYQPL